MQLHLNKKNRIYKEISKYTAYRQKLKKVDRIAATKLKKKVLQSMASAIQK